MLPAKRRRFSDEDGAENSDNGPLGPSSTKTKLLDSLHRGISPPQLSKNRSLGEVLITKDQEFHQTSKKSKHATHQKQADTNYASGGGRTHTTPRPAQRSPFKLTRIRDLPAECNVDTVGINDLLGDPLIREAWLFDYLFDIHWLM